VLLDYLTIREDFKIYRIPNPSQKADLFMFDDGWRSTAEQDESE
jgi:hypothetical protein